MSDFPGDLTFVTRSSPRHVGCSSGDQLFANRFRFSDPADQVRLLLHTPPASTPEAAQPVPVLAFTEQFLDQLPTAQVVNCCSGGAALDVPAQKVVMQVDAGPGPFACPQCGAMAAALRSQAPPLAPSGHDQNTEILTHLTAALRLLENVT